VHLDDAAPYRGRVIATEYLGTTQIVTLDTPLGPVKTRVASHRAIRAGDTTGLRFDARTITLFSAETGRALQSHGNAGGLRHG